jgi:hypothetical protein
MPAHNNISMKNKNLVLQLEKVCFQACKELEEAYNLIKKPTDERKENITFSC